MPGIGNNIYNNVLKVNRNIQLQQMISGPFDICIIGAGASGAGCALDAALRGFRVLLVDRGDFSCETSSKSTKLIHGGVRYLEQAFKNLDFAQLRQVRHGLEERHLLLANAPHLAQPLGLVTPVFSWIEGLYFTIGLKLYDWIASRKDNLPSSEWLSKKTVRQMIPTISGKIHSAVLYYDGQLDDARYTLALTRSAAEAGATVLNYAEVVGFQKDNNGILTGVILKDRLSDDGNAVINVSVKTVLNCTGPFSDHIRQMANPDLSDRIRPSKGVHAILPANVLSSKNALLIPKTPDGRVVFALPFHGQVMLGTTDEKYDHLEQEPLLESGEVDFLLETLEPYLDRKVDKSEVKSGFGGVRPLITAGKQQTKGLLRDHEVEFDETSGLFSLLGGKWTTYRLMARDAVDAVCRHLGIDKKCTTENFLLAGAKGYRADGWEIIQAETAMEADICRHLNSNYGSHSTTIATMIAQDKSLGERLIAGFPFVKAEVVYSVRHEMCCTIRDFIARRTRLEILDWQAAIAAAPEVARLLAAEIHWSEEKMMKELRMYQNLLRHFVENSK